jgi:hypothetical protein
MGNEVVALFLCVISTREELMLVPTVNKKRLAATVALVLSAVATPILALDYQDHYEFEASLNAPYRASADHSRTFNLDFRFPGADDGSVISLARGYSG